MYPRSIKALFIFPVAIGVLVLSNFGILVVYAQNGGIADPKVSFCFNVSGTPLKAGDPNCKSASFSTSSYLFSDGKFYGVCRTQDKLATGYAVNKDSLKVTNGTPTCADVGTFKYQLVSASSFTSLVTPPVNTQTVTGVADPNVEFCYNSTGGVSAASSSSCKNAATYYSSVFLNPNDNKFYGVCRSSSKIGNAYIPATPTVSSGNKVTCDAGFLLQSTNFFTGLPKTSFGGATNTNTNKNTGSNTQQSNGGTIATSGDCEGLVKSGPLCLPPPTFSNSSGIASSTSIKDLIPKIINFALWVAGIVAVGMTMFGGYQVMTAGGNDKQSADGKKTLTNAIIGLVIIVFSYAVVNAIVRFITTGAKQ